MFNNEQEIDPALLRWYTDRQKSELDTSEGNLFLKLLKEEPEKIVSAILRQIDHDIPVAVVQTRKAYEITGNQEFAEGVVEHFKSVFLSKGP